jgi:hypothetical protein
MRALLIALLLISPNRQPLDLAAGYFLNSRFQPSRGWAMSSRTSLCQVSRSLPSAVVPISITEMVPNGNLVQKINFQPPQAQAAEISDLLLRVAQMSEGLVDSILRPTPLPEFSYGTGDDVVIC